MKQKIGNALAWTLPTLLLVAVFFVEMNKLSLIMFCIACVLCWLFWKFLPESLAVLAKGYLLSFTCLVIGMIAIFGPAYMGGVIIALVIASVGVPYHLPGFLFSFFGAKRWKGKQGAAENGAGMEAENK